MVFYRTRKQWERARTEPVEPKRSESAPTAPAKPKRKPRKKAAEK